MSAVSLLNFRARVWLGAGVAVAFAKMVHPWKSRRPGWKPKRSGGWFSKSGRSADAKRNLYRTLVQRLGDIAVKPTDVSVVILEPTLESWAFDSPAVVRRDGVQ